MFGGATCTLTFCESGENHVGMQRIGEKGDVGFTCEELKAIHMANPECAEYYDLNTDLEQQEMAGLLVIRGGLSQCFGIDPKDLLEEQNALLKVKVDKQALMRGRVVNKHARWNLCFGDFSQEPDYASGKGTVVDFATLSWLSSLRERLPTVFGEKASKLIAEGNYYYDITKCYIGYHGDSERRRVIGVRLGESMPLHLKWYLNGEERGEKMTVMLHHGDMYCFSEKAVGTDWKRRKIWTLRHSAGFNSKGFVA